MEKYGKKHGDRSTPKTRLRNAKYSLSKLTRTLGANFTEESQLVTLSYHPGKWPRSRKLSLCYTRDWMASVRKVWAVPRYVSATRWPGGETGPQHMFIVSGCADAAQLASLWPYGPATVAGVQLVDGWGHVACMMMWDSLRTEEGRTPCARSWTVSLGLARPQRGRG